MKIICSTGEIVYSYKEYLKTKHWANKKIEYSKNNKSICSMCGANNCKLDLHHMTYENIGNEKMSDLIYLCSNCHSKIHKNLDRFKDTTILKHLKEVKKKSRKVKDKKPTTCKGCIHESGKNGKRGCDLGYDHSRTISKKCKRYCTNDYMTSKKEIDTIKEYKRINEESKNKKEVLTPEQKEARRKAFEKRKRYM